MSMGTLNVEILYQFLKGNGFGPWRCFFCNGVIPVKALVERRDHYRDRDVLVIHHRDQDRSNNRPSNLKPSHNGCHTAHHNTGKKASPEARAKMSESHLRRGREHRRLRS